MSSLRRFFDDFLNQTILFGYDRIGYNVRKKLWNETDTECSMENKICVVTGANSGLGKATSKHLARLGATVYLICRNPELGREAQQEIIGFTGNSKVYLEIVDTSEPEQIKNFAGRFQPDGSRVDVLVNNAGVLLNDRQENSAGLEKTFATNTLGYFLMTNLLLPLLVRSAAARVVNVSSGGMYGAAVQLDDYQYLERKYNGVLAYAESKRAEVILSEIWAEKLRSKNIFVSSMHPGWADTKGVKSSLPTFRKLTRPILRNAREGADTIIWLAVNPELTVEHSGLFWFDRKPRAIFRSPKTKHSVEEAKKLWELCCQLGDWSEDRRR